MVVIVGAWLMLAACHSQRATLDADNPLMPVAPPPHGMEEFFKDAPQPQPARVRLGRWLFFDARLSADSTVSCATCHKPEFAFSEQTAVATGIGGQQGSRKTPSIINLAARTVIPGEPRDPGPVFSWDGRVTSLEAQALAPIADAREMGLAHGTMVSRFATIPGYERYFKEAFGSSEVTAERIAAALADYVRTRRSGNSSYDRWAYGRDSKALSLEAQRGSDIFFFKGRCATCHTGFNFSDGLFHNIGIGWDSATKTFKDPGRFAVTQHPADLGAFKTPGLRDVDKHPPYMHDGSMATLKDVVDFYNRGGHPEVRNGRIAPLGLSQADVDAVVAFLKSLNGEGYQDRSPTHFPR
ncbi:MAG: hypothetical protein RLZZ53_2468 [Acidobacteriota bacterium]